MSRPKTFKPWFDADGRIVDTSPALHLVRGDIEPYRAWSLPGAPVITSRAHEAALLRQHGKEALSPSEVTMQKALYKPPALPPIRDAMAAARDTLIGRSRRK